MSILNKYILRQKFTMINTFYSLNSSEAPINVQMFLACYSTSQWDSVEVFALIRVGLCRSV